MIRHGEEAEDVKQPSYESEGKAKFAEDSLTSGLAACFWRLV
jgi:hypothetical protein